MSSHRIADDLHRLLATSSNVISDPGSNGTFNLYDCPYFGLATIASGTRKLPDNMPTGTLFYVKSTGSVTITNASGTTVLTLGNGQMGIFLCTSSTTWVGALFTTGYGAASSASLVAFDDQSSLDDYTATTNVGAALYEIYAHLLDNSGSWQRGVPLSTLREVDTGGDVANAASNGGLLASDTTPILLGDAAEALAVQWAASNSDIVAFTVDVPTNMDGAGDVFVELLVQSAGTSNAPSFSVLTNFDGGAQITDSATGTAVSTKQTITATIAFADVPTSAMVMSVQLVPGAHATDAWTLYGIRVRGKQTLLS